MRTSTIKMIVFFIGTVVYAQKDSIPHLQNDALKPYESTIENWLHCYNISLDKFDFVSSDTLSTEETIFDTQSYMSIYLPYCRASSDKNQILDVCSYHYIFKKDNIARTISAGTNVDSEVSLINWNRKTHKRLLFGGSQTRFHDAFWLDNYHIIVVGGEFLYRFVPEIWLIDLQRNTIDFYMYITVLPRYPKCNYRKFKYPDVIFTSK